MGKSKDINNKLLNFRDELLHTPAKKYIMKIILFGSYAKGEAKTESDIDLLIVRANGKKAEEVINSCIYDVMLKTKLPIEAITCPVEETFWIDSYFIYNILSYGKEVFSVNKENLKQQAIKGLLNLAREYLSSSKECAKSKNWRLAVDGEYNACELMVKALLFKKLDDLPGSHGRVVNKFGQIYIKTNKLERSLVESLIRGLQLRNWARYKWQKEITEKHYKFLLNLARKLEEATKKIIKD